MDLRGRILLRVFFHALHFWGLAGEGLVQKVLARLVALVFEDQGGGWRVLTRTLSEVVEHLHWVIFDLLRNLFHNIELFRFSW